MCRSRYTGDKPAHAPCVHPHAATRYRTCITCTTNTTLHSLHYTYYPFTALPALHYTALLTCAVLIDSSTMLCLDDINIITMARGRNIV